jgi:hypothetical protein
LVLQLGGCTGKHHVFPANCASEVMLNKERFAYAILAADELVAVSNTIKFRYDDGKTFLNWKIGEDVDNAVWISVFLILAVTINMFPVKVREAIPVNLRRVSFANWRSGFWRA